MPLPSGLCLAVVARVRAWCRYLECGEAVLKGELVMLLPPNLLLWEEEVDDFNTCLQAISEPSRSPHHLRWAPSGDQGRAVSLKGVSERQG